MSKKIIYYSKVDAKVWFVGRTFTTSTRDQHKLSERELHTISDKLLPIIKKNFFFLSIITLCGIKCTLFSYIFGIRCQEQNQKRKYKRYNSTISRIWFRINHFSRALDLANTVLKCWDAFISKKSFYKENVVSWYIILT